MPPNGVQKVDKDGHTLVVPGPCASGPLLYGLDDEMGKAEGSRRKRKRDRKRRRKEWTD